MTKKYTPARISLIALFVFLEMMNPLHALSQEKLDRLLPVRAISMHPPGPNAVDSFIRFIHEELAPRKINTLILQMDYHYEFQSHPELRDSAALSKDDVKKLVKACREEKIRLIPMIDLLGHQSWANKPHRLLKVYPQFDETPWIQMPEKYEWPNPDNLYCKSYCPLHPEVHDVVFAVMDELCDVFESDAFHAGMDEVFYLGESQCPRCGGKDKAELFAGEVKRIHDHLQAKHREMWIWGDRLLDAEQTKLGIWEASANHTAPAVDIIPKDVVICDWHYDSAAKTPQYFAQKGFRVIACPWRTPSVALEQLQDMLDWRRTADAKTRKRYLGIMQTTWTRNDLFRQGFYADDQPDPKNNESSWNCFRVLYSRILGL